MDPSFPSEPTKKDERLASHAIAIMEQNEIKSGNMEPHGEHLRSQ